MGIKTNIRLLLIFLLFRLIFNDTVRPSGKITFPKTSEEKTFTASKMPGRYYLFFRVLFVPENTEGLNPLVLTGTDNQSKNPINVGTQPFGPIYFSINFYQFNNLYICVKNIPTNQAYYIEVENTERYILPFNKLTRYYISDDNMETAYFLFKSEEDIDIHEISFLAKGRDITMEIEANNDLEKKILNDGILYYGFSNAKEFYFIIEGSIGDYITVGSTHFPNSGNIDFLSENSNEIIVATEHKRMCFSLNYPSYINYINGIIYTMKAITYFADSNKNIININTKELKSEIYNGIISEQNTVGNLKSDYTEGFYCLKFESQLNIISI